jgi:hypothetical protein
LDYFLEASSKLLKHSYASPKEETAFMYLRDKTFLYQNKEDVPFVIKQTILLTIEQRAMLNSCHPCLRKETQKLRNGKNSVFFCNDKIKYKNNKQDKVYQAF